MIYRAQFAFPTPPGFQDVESEQFFDFQSNPGLSQSPPNPSPIYNIPLTLDPDAEFRWRGVKFDHTNNANIGFRFRDPYGNYMASDFVPVWLLFISPSNTLTTGGPCNILEPEVICPKNSVIMLDVISYDATPWTSGGPSPICLYGVKRYPSGADC